MLCARISSHIASKEDHYIVASTYPQTSYPKKSTTHQIRDLLAHHIPKGSSQTICKNLLTHRIQRGSLHSSFNISSNIVSKEEHHTPNSRSPRTPYPKGIIKNHMQKSPHTSHPRGSLHTSSKVSSNIMGQQLHCLFFFVVAWWCYCALWMQLLLVM